MKIKRSEQELAYLEKREREVGLQWWTDFCLWFFMRGMLYPPLVHLYLQLGHQMPPKES